MAILGNPSKPGNHWHSYQGNGYPSQEAEKLTASRFIKITSVGAWIGGWNRTCRVRLTVWDGATRAVLGQSAEIVVPNKGAGGPAGGNVNAIEAPLAVPVELAGGRTIYVGFVRHGDDGHQVSAGSDSSGQHIEGKIGAAAYPGAALANDKLLTRRIGCWAVYEDISGAHVHRAGAFARGDVVVERAGAKAPAQRVAVFRSGAWKDGA